MVSCDGVLRAVGGNEAHQARPARRCSMAWPARSTRSIIAEASPAQQHCLLFIQCFLWLSCTCFITMSANQLLLFVIVGQNEPLYEAEILKTASTASDSATRQNYFVLHSALDLVDKAAWTTNNMYLKVVDKVGIVQ